MFSILKTLVTSHSFQFFSIFALLLLVFCQLSSLEESPHHLQNTVPRSKTHIGKRQMRSKERKTLNRPFLNHCGNNTGSWRRDQRGRDTTAEDCPLTQSSWPPDSLQSSHNHCAAVFLLLLKLSLGALRTPNQHRGNLKLCPRVPNPSCCSGNWALS